MGRRFTPALPFHSSAAIFDRFSELLGFGTNFKKRVIALAKIKNGERLLDIGCGTGVLLVEAKKECPKIDVTGIDADPKMVSYARHKLEAAGTVGKVLKTYAQRLRFPSNSFDIVISTLTFHHLSTEAKEQAIGEIRRVMKTDGRFLLADFGKPRSLIGKILLYIGSIFDGQENMRANLQGKIPEMLRRAGFAVRETGPRYRGVQFLLATMKRTSSHRTPS